MTRRNVILGIAVLLLSAQAGLTHWLSRDELLPEPGPVETNIPTVIGNWNRTQDGILDPDAYAMLSPDDVLNRTYRNTDGDLNLFIAYYKTQLRAKNAHDPKVCLPGSGWNPLESKTISVPVEGQPAPIGINYYVISKNQEKAVVLYWFQNHKKAYAEEQALRFARVLDNLMENRTDMALVRIVVPATQVGIESATKSGLDFISKFYPSLAKQFPL